MIIRHGTKYDVTTLAENCSIFEGVIGINPVDHISEDEEYFTVLDDQGRIIMIAGLSELWTGRAVGWALFGKSVRWNMLALHRAVSKYLDSSKYQRIEATAVVGFKPGQRWLEMLGFTLEGYLQKYDPSGRDHLLYARVR